MKREVNMRQKPTDKAEKGIKEGIAALHNVNMQADGRIITDPLGSWTGIPTDDIFDTPVQDVDDL